MNKSHLIGTPCPICKATFQESCNRGEVFCSSYCEGATKEEIEEFLKAKPGEYCIYPCPECRTAIEGELPVEGEPGAGCCSDCSRTIQVREQKKLLERAFKILQGTSWSVQGAEFFECKYLIEDIKKQLNPRKPE